MAAKTRVTVVGASGETGQSIINGLLESPESFDVSALARPASVGKAEYDLLRERGVNVISADLSTVNEQLLRQLDGVDVVISCLTLTDIDAQTNLATACKKAGVGRYVPSCFGPVCPPRGVMALRDMKEDHIDLVKRMYLPYTIIDVGWWTQLSLPYLPSGRLDDKLVFPITNIVGDGNKPMALIDNRDIGKFVARIITEPQTVNRSVFAYSEMYTQNQVFDILQQLSGETVERLYVDEQELLEQIANNRKRIAQGDTDPSLHMFIGTAEYAYSWGVRGDDTPEHAEYLGYLDARKLYPDVQVGSLKQYITGLLDGSIARVYDGRRDPAKK